MATPFPIFCDQELIIHSNLACKEKFGVAILQLFCERKHLGCWVFDHTTTNTRQAREDDPGEYIPMPLW